MFPEWRGQGRGGESVSVETGCGTCVGVGSAAAGALIEGPFAWAAWTGRSATTGLRPLGEDWISGERETGSGLGSEVAHAGVM